MEKIQDGIFSLARTRVARRRVNLVITLILSHAGLVEMMMNLAVWNIVQFPRQ
jgi:hypothetical protein